MLHRHWVKVYTVLEQPTPGNLDMQITLNELIESYNALDHCDEIEDISGAA